MRKTGAHKWKPVQDTPKYNRGLTHDHLALNDYSRSLTHWRRSWTQWNRILRLATSALILNESLLARRINSFLLDRAHENLYRECFAQPIIES